MRAFAVTNDLKREINFPHSIGLLYSAFTYYTGFKVNSGEYKVMGLAPYGEPKYTGLIRIASTPTRTGSGGFIPKIATARCSIFWRR